MPILLLYMATLLLAAWQTELGSRFLERPHALAFQLLDRIGFRAGMRVFGGSDERMSALLRARCTIVDGVDASGHKTRIYPTNACPLEGFRWQPALYDHMIVHWTAWLKHGNYDANLAALGDHFCQQAKDDRFTHVELRLEFRLIDYETGRKWTQPKELGRVECR